MQKLTAIESVRNLTNALSRAMIRKVELLDELEVVNKQITGIREGLQGVKLGEAIAREKAAADVAAQKEAIQPTE